MDLAEIAMPVAAATIVGSFVVEWIFRIPGAGSVFILAIKTRDYNMIAGLVVLYSVGMAVGNLLVDVISAWIDPRVWTA
jgi:oligopeptide transport system permease protein